MVLSLVGRMKQVEILAVVQVEEWPDAGHIEDNSAVVQLWGRAVEVQAGLAETLSAVPVELVGGPVGHADLHAGRAEKVNIFAGQVGCGEPTELQAAVKTLALVLLG